MKIKNICKLNFEEKATAMRSFGQLLTFNWRYSANGDGVTVSSSNAHEMEQQSCSNIPLQDARILYSVAPAMGHNKVCC